MTPCSAHAVAMAIDAALDLLDNIEDPDTCEMFYFDQSMDRDEGTEITLKTEDGSLFRITVTRLLPPDPAR